MKWSQAFLRHVSGLMRRIAADEFKARGDRDVRAARSTFLRDISPRVEKIGFAHSPASEPCQVSGPWASVCQVNFILMLPRFRGARGPRVGSPAGPNLASAISAFSTSMGRAKRPIAPARRRATAERPPRWLHTGWCGPHAERMAEHPRNASRRRAPAGHWIS